MVPNVVSCFEDFRLWTYVLVDEVWPQIAPPCRRPGPSPACSDPALITMALVGECQGWDEETVLVSHWHAHRDLFPHQPERSRFNRRRRQLVGAIIAVSTDPPTGNVVICLDDMGPDSAKSHPGTRVLRPDLTGEKRLRATQEIEYGRRGKGYVFAAFQPATGEAFTAPYDERTITNWCAFLDQVEG